MKKSACPLPGGVAARSKAGPGGAIKTIKDNGPSPMPLDKNASMAIMKTF